MNSLILRLHDFFATHPLWRWLTLCVVTLLLAASALTVNFKEQIQEFLPLDRKSKLGLEVYEQINGADRVAVLFSTSENVEAPEVVTAMEMFADTLSKADTLSLTSPLLYRADMETAESLLDFLYENIPYFLTESDYRNMEELLSSEESVRERLEEEKRRLMLPGNPLLRKNLERDPLNLFDEVAGRLQGDFSPLNYELYDGYIFSPALEYGVVLFTSPYGMSESSHNAALLRMVEGCAHAVTARTGVEIQVVGGPVVAVGNARQIEHDSLLAVTLAVVLILTVLFLVFRDWRNLLLMALSVGWGWLFALGTLGLARGGVSIIVIGIGSVIIGIAVNYPLHLTAHLSHAPTKRDALKEIISPLLVGNVTTVGAFLALVPLKGAALRDLGLFASLLLAGTILFVLLYLPHLARTARRDSGKGLLTRLSGVQLEKRPWVVALILLLTPLLALFSRRTGFDTDISHINYMEPAQRTLLNYFSSVMKGEGSNSTIYVVWEAPTQEDALQLCEQGKPCLQKLVTEGLVSSLQTCTPLLPSSSEQQRRLERWQRFIDEYGAQAEELVSREAAGTGFRAGAFTPFFSLLKERYSPRPLEYFSPLSETLLSGYLCSNTSEGSFRVVDKLAVEKERVTEVKSLLENNGILAFDVAGLNSTMAANLQSEFNYIGWACGFIVFIFLWLTLGSIELALISFVPMAISWIWILGIMGLAGMDFNIVNVILATFIFGQGDDYTIFMTEGSTFEYARRRPIIAHYKSSIITSATVMFIGMGTLIVARHPALASLAKVTLVGMSAVALMACLFPPLLFDLLVRRNGEWLVRPFRIANLFRSLVARVCPGHTPGVSLVIPPELEALKEQPAVWVGGHDMPLYYPIMKKVCGRNGVILPPGSLVVAASLAEERGLKAVEVKLINAGRLFSKSGFQMYAGELVVEAALLAAKGETAERMTAGGSGTDLVYYRELVLDRYRYKGAEIFNSVARSLSGDLTPLTAPQTEETDLGEQTNYGEKSLLMALLHKDCIFTVAFADRQKAEILAHSAEGLASNLIIRYINEERNCQSIGE